MEGAIISEIQGWVPPAVAFVLILAILANQWWFFQQNKKSLRSLFAACDRLMGDDPNNGKRIDQVMRVWQMVEELHGWHEPVVKDGQTYLPWHNRPSVEEGIAKLVANMERDRDRGSRVEDRQHTATQLHEMRKALATLSDRVTKQQEEQ